MLNETGCRLIARRDDRDQVTRNALLESFVLHARSLIDFLYQNEAGAPPKSDDMIAADYLPPGGQLPELPDDLKEWRTRVHKLAAHMTYSRNVLNRQWPCGRILDQLNSAFQEFVTRAQPTLIGERVRRFQPRKVSSNGSPDSATSGDSVGPCGYLSLEWFGHCAKTEMANARRITRFICIGVEIYDAIL
jgi:hypothetical protein